MYRIWLLISAAVLAAVLGCHRPASGEEPAPRPAAAPATPARG
ncbi:hypothetical protein [Streptomyces sp. NBC_00582]|nr:hypothetical protein [Streptomyces sp. NBC_00582]WUB61508.1 hypothetical protein OG852_14465 [Streptomyces sp. NBC_00582]